jgi:D-arabinose 1-dehydrogenase-like Zn-dependent alcohol dehydrogenase
MLKTMKAAVVREFGAPLVIEEVPIPQVGPGQIQVAIHASGVCHTDLHAAEGDWPVKPKPPFIPGHEGVGFVAAVGAGVKATGSACPGFTPPAAIACIASAVGRLCARPSSILAIPLMAVLRIT